MEISVGNNKNLKTINRLLIRDTIRKKGPIARYELAKETGLTPSTVGGIVNELINEGIVREVGYGESTGGRRPVMLELNSNSAYIFAARIQKGELAMALFNLGGEVLNQQRQILNTNLPEEIVGIIRSYYDWVIENNQIKKEKILCCGLATPGLINSHKGIIVRSSNLDWRNVPIRELLSTSLGGIPVRLEQNANAAAIAELEYGRGKGCLNLIYINLSIGISAGIIINGKIYSGEFGYAGELGHTTFFPQNGPICACGRYGCFEASCGAHKVLEQIMDKVPQSLFEKYGMSKGKITIEDVIASPLLNVPQVKDVFKEIGKMIGIAVANLLKLFNVSTVILGGELSKAGDLLIKEIISEMKQRTQEEIGENVRIVQSTMKKDPQLMGVYALALEEVFSFDEW